MSIHRSLVSSSTLKRHRNVLTRAERLVKMEQDGQWHDGNSIYGLPKVKGELKIKKAKSGGRGAKKPEEGAAAAGAAPAAGATPAAAGAKKAEAPKKEAGEKKK